MNVGRNITAENGQIEGGNGLFAAESGQIGASMQETAGNKKTATIINHLRANAAELKKWPRL